MQRLRLRHYLFTALYLSFHLSTNDGTSINNAYQYIVIRKTLFQNVRRAAGEPRASLNLINSVIKWALI